MTPIQQLMLGVGASKKTYLDDVFSTYLWNGNSATRQVATGLDMSGEGGMVAIKSRSHSQPWVIGGTGLGDNHCLAFDTNGGKDNSSSKFKRLLSAGFEIGDDHEVNSSSDSKTYSGFSFRKAPGFFDVVTYTGTGSARTISHSLGSIPGMILVKKTSGSEDWTVYHRESGIYKWLYLNTTDGVQGPGANPWNGASPTASVFSLGTHNLVNENGETYVAYVFAGGKSTTDKAVEFDGTGDYLTVGSSSNYTLGTGDFTIECWVKFDDTDNRGIFQISTDTTGLSTATTSTLAVSHNGTVWHCYGGGSGNNNSSSFTRQTNKWYHLAFVRQSGTTKLYVDGIQQVSFSDSYNYTGTYLAIGGYYQTGFLMDGNISNFRVVKGEALYTSEFVPLANPVTRYSSTTKLLCCDGSSTTASTVVSGTITANGDPTVTSNNSIFDDPAGFVFGDAGDQNVIKTGSYVGDGNGGSNQGIANSHEIYLGWEPQWVLIKRSNQAESWILYDSIRGISNVSAENQDAKFEVNNNDAESLLNHIDLTSTGFTFTTGNNQVNSDGDDFIYMAIRRPDGYVGKPADAGTDVFAMAYGNASGTNPSYVSNFPVDFALNRQPATSENWYTTSRLIQGNYLLANTTAVEADASNYLFDHNNGWRDGSAVTAYLSWMWKRHAGFDVVTANNLPFGAVLPHSLGRTPEMIIAKNRNNTFVWGVYHKGLNGGTNPEQYRLKLNTDDAEQQVTEAWNNTAPTATHFTVGANHTGNSGGADYQPIFFLFASVNGISKVGSYTGSDSAQTITLGFQPRFVIIKNRTNTNDWIVIDSVRGIASSDGNNSKKLQLNHNFAEDNTDVVYSSGQNFTVNGNELKVNDNGASYIYYAHA